MPTLILSPRYTPDSITVRRAALEASWEVLRLASWRCPEGLEIDEPVVYGEPLFAAVVAEALELALFEPPFDWLARLPLNYCRRLVQFASLHDALTHSRPAFIKPCDDKCFPARVYAPGEPIPGSSDLPPETPVLIVEPVIWRVEYRSFVLDREIVAISPYLRAGELVCDAQGDWPAPEDEQSAARRFATEFVADPEVAIPPACVVDVGWIEGRGWAVVEANSAFGSGIYGCDPPEVLPVLKRACKPRRAVLPAEAAWIQHRASCE